MAKERDCGRWVRRVALSTATLTLLGAGHATPVWTAEHFEGRGRAVERWGHGDIGRFHEHDLDRWRGGHWIHGDHLGRLGWWWIVDGSWYFYPAAIYPYPDPYVPPAVVAGVPATASYWYYCPSARAYYPYVRECPEGWMQVVPQAAPPGP